MHVEDDPLTTGGQHVDVPPFPMSKSDRVTLMYRDGTQPAYLVNAICQLYDTVFSQPPFRWANDESDHHRQSLTRIMTNPTFGLATAEETDELVGFAYGVALGPDTSWWSGMVEPLPDELIAEWNRRTFAVIDLAVRDDCRKRGIGRALLGRLLGHRQEQRATLTVQPIATDTKQFYAHLGWQRLGTTRAPAGAVSPFFDVYLLPLHANP
ncbi:MAG: GNAT family N-acetyltransferase [Pseudonocardiaceae bacterium]